VYAAATGNFELGTTINITQLKVELAEPVWNLPAGVVPSWETDGNNAEVSFTFSDGLFEDGSVEIEFDLLITNTGKLPIKITSVELKDEPAFIKLDVADYSTTELIIEAEDDDEIPIKLTVENTAPIGAHSFKIVVNFEQSV